MPRSYAPIVERFDAIVVGAGPAGSLTAHLLAARGRQYAARRPRAVPARQALRRRRHDARPAAPAVRDRARGRAADHHDRLPSPRSGRVRARRARARRPDDAAQAARRVPGRAGRARGRRLPRRREAARGGAGRRRAAGRHLRRRLARGRRGADRRRRRERHRAGARSSSGQDRIFAPALEANVAYDAVGARRASSTSALLELGYIPGGYGWVFPKGDHANVGVGGWDSQGPHLREHLRRGLRPPRHRLVGAHRDARPPAPDARRRRRGSRAAARWPSATRPGSSIRSRATACTRPSPARTWPRPACATSSRAARATSRRYPGRLDAALGRHTSLAWIAKAAIERAPGVALRVARSRAIRQAGS